MNPIYIQPLVEFGFDILGALSPVIVTIATGYLIMVARKHGLLQDAKLQVAAQSQIADVLDRGLVFATHYGETNAAQLGPIRCDDARIAALANFLIAQAPAALKRTGINPTTPAGRTAIVQLAMAHLPPNSTVPAVSTQPASGATPKEQA